MINAPYRLSFTNPSPKGPIIFVSSWVSNSRYSYSSFNEKLISRLMHLRERADGGRAVHFLGRGWGHGIGLCQNGAYGLARAGRGFEEILGHYYTGIHIVRWRHAGDGLQSMQQ